MMKICNWFWVTAVALPLLLMAFVPALHLPAYEFAHGLFENGESIFNLPTSVRGIPISTILERNSNSIGAQTWAIQNGVFPGELHKFQTSGNLHLRKAEMLAFAELLKSHPNNIALLARTLNSSPGSYQRTGGPWESNWTYGRAIAMSRPSPAFYMAELTPVELSLCLGLARRGQQLEPNNTYFDWSIAHYLFEQGKDEEAVQTLLRAGRKTGCDSHGRDTIREVTAAIERVHPLLPEEKAYLIATARMTPSKIPHTCNLALWWAMRKEDQGNFKAALEIEAALIRLCHTMEQYGESASVRATGSNNLLRVWQAPQDMHWARLSYKGMPRTTKFSAEHVISDAANPFAVYARAHGREDLAQATLKMIPGQIQILKQLGVPYSTYENVMDWPKVVIDPVTLSWAGVGLSLTQAAFALVLWLASTILGPMLPPRGEMPPRLGARFILFPLLPTLPLWLNSFLAARTNPNDFEGYAIFPVFAPFVLGPLFCCVGTWLRLRHLQPPEVQPLAPRDLGASAAMDVYHKHFWRLQGWLWFWVLPVVIAGIFLACLRSPHWWWALRSADIENFATTGLSFYLVILISRWRFFMPRFQRGVVYTGFLIHRRVLAWTIPFSLWIVVAWLAYGNGQRVALEAQVDSFLEMESGR